MSEHRWRLRLGTRTDRLTKVCACLLRRASIAWRRLGRLHGLFATRLDPDSQGGDGTLALFRAKLAAKLQAAGPDVDAQRAAAIAALKEELAADVQAMREAVQAEDYATYNEVWQDILGLRLSNLGTPK